MLYVCATPIGNLSDVTLRVLETLRTVDLIAAEDTRCARKLLARYDIHTPLTSLFAHNEAQKTAMLLEQLRDGRQVALVTDAGLPGIADPGTRLVSAALTEGLPMTVLPGASAPVTALVASGLTEAEGFRFVGYLARRPVDLARSWGDWRRCGGVVVAFESPRRLARSLTTLAGLAPDVRAAVCRELTKIHEEVVRGTVTELAQRFSVPPADVAGAGGKAVRRSRTVRGEITLVFDLGPPCVEKGGLAVEDAARQLLVRGLSRRDAAAAVAICLGVARRVADEVVRGVAAR